jgi:hypothetical protein
MKGLTITCISTYEHDSQHVRAIVPLAGCGADTSVGGIGPTAGNRGVFYRHHRHTNTTPYSHRVAFSQARVAPVTPYNKNS